MEVASRMIIMSGKPEIGVQTTTKFGPVAPRIVVVTRLDRSRAVCHLPDAAHVITQVVVFCVPNLDSLLIMPLCHLVCLVALFGQRQTIPDELFCACDARAGFLDDLHPPA